MEEFKAKIDSFFQLGNDLAKYDKVVEDFLKGLEKQSLISECIVDKTRRQSKRKRNILSSIPNNDNESSEKIIEHILLPKKSLNTNKTKSGTTSMNKLEIENATANSTYECVYEDAISDTVIKLEPKNSNERPEKHSEVAVVRQPVDPGETNKFSCFTQNNVVIQNSSTLKGTKVNVKALQSPAPVRITRMNSRAQVKKENRYAIPPFAHIPIPDSNRKPLRHVVGLKQTSSSQTMPIANIHLKKKYDSIPSKLLGECNAEDIKRIAAEDKKRIQEEKHKHAQEIREAKERERRAERTAREKQSKSKKIVYERAEKGRQECDGKKTLRERMLQKDSQRNLEEIQKNLQIPKCMEVQRDEEMRKMKLANMKCDLLEATSTKPAEKQKQYTFDLLLTDDSSEEEDKLSTKKPPPPTWSLATVRQSVVQQQNYVEWKIIDKLFSIQPMTIDLREIFPNIDSRFLARNSSGIWLTPQRCLVLPEWQ